MDGHVGGAVALRADRRARLATWLERLAAQIAVDLGDDAAAREHADRGWQLAGELNQIMLSAWALNVLGQAAMQRGDVAAAVEPCDQYLALIRDTENAIVKNLIIGRAAETYLAAGRVDEAARLGQIAAGRRDAFEARDAFAAIGTTHDRVRADRLLENARAP
jgi:ATP/maltotriose-dependent transcriptional regulator MalT